MRSLWLWTNRWLTWFHRWSGVALCLLFVAWFASGAVLLYVPFPALAQSDRLAHSEPIEGSRLIRDPATVLAEAPDAERLLVVSIAGHPTYLAFSANGRPTALSGDGSPVPPTFPAATARVVAERFGHAAVRRVEGPLEYDQWIVHQRFDPFRPFYRVRLSDADQTDLYVSARTGQVLQWTHGTERAWNWCGAVLHWIYFTPLRKSWSAWNQTVWWLSLLALLGGIAGTWLGIDRFVRTRASARTAWSPFRGWMRWHHVIGLFASVIVLVWIFSGWLSMDHGRLFSKAEVPAEGALRFQGVPLDSIARSVQPGFMRHLGSPAELSFGAVAGQPFVAARGGLPSSSRIYWLQRPDSSPTPSIAASFLISGLQAAWPGETIIQAGTQSNPDFYRVAESLDQTAVPFIVGASTPLRVYVDSVTGQLLVVMDGSRRAYAWVYYALHTFNFPLLLTHTSARDVVVLLLLAIGLTFSCTGVVLGVQRLRRSFAR
jgi:uncharacterized iron-regulated membrane protein